MRIVGSFSLDFNQLSLRLSILKRRPIPLPIQNRQAPLALDRRHRESFFGCQLLDEKHETVSLRWLDISMNNPVPMDSGKSLKQGSKVNPYVITIHFPIKHLSEISLPRGSVVK